MTPPVLFSDGLISARRFADYSGRSSRTELFAYWLMTFLAGGALLIAAALVEFIFGMSNGPSRALMLGYQTIITFPLVALWVRRLHDQGRTGLWVLTIVSGAIVGTVKHYATLTWNFDLLFDPLLGKLNLAAFLLALPAIVFLFWPGNEDANRYGPNPRYDPSGEPA